MTPRDRLESTRWLRATSLSFRAEVVRSVRIRTVQGESWLYGVDDEPTGPIAVLSGALAFDLPMGPNARFAEWPVQPGHWIGAAVLMMGGTRRTNLRAVVTSEIAEVRASAWRRIVKSDPNAWRYLGMNVVENLQIAISVAASLMLRPAEARIAALLLLLSESGFTDDQTRYPVRLPQSEVAYLCGVSRSAFSRHLCDFDNQGLIRTSYRAIEVLDAPRLIDVSESGGKHMDA